MHLIACRCDELVTNIFLISDRLGAEDRLTFHWAYVLNTVPKLGQRVRGSAVKAVWLITIAVFCVACSKSPPEAEPAIASGVGLDTGDAATDLVSAGDFRGYRWGESLDGALEREGQRSERIDDSWSFHTQIAGYPAVLSLLAHGELLAGARYQFPWPVESEKCMGPMTPGSKCSVESAGYAVDVCDRIGTLLTEKYRLVDAERKPVANRRISSAGALDQSLSRRSDHGLSMVVSSWENDRTSVSQTFAGGAKDAQGWRCTFTYRASPEIDAQLLREATDAEIEEAKRDL